MWVFGYCGQLYALKRKMKWRDFTGGQLGGNIPRPSWSHSTSITIDSSNRCPFKFHCSSSALKAELKMMLQVYCNGRNFGYPVMTSFSESADHHQKRGFLQAWNQWLTLPIRSGLSTKKEEEKTNFAYLHVNLQDSIFEYFHTCNPKWIFPLTGTTSWVGMLFCILQCGISRKNLLVQSLPSPTSSMISTKMFVSAAASF